MSPSSIAQRFLVSVSRITHKHDHHINGMSHINSSTYHIIYETYNNTRICNHAHVISFLIHKLHNASIKFKVCYLISISNICFVATKSFISKSLSSSTFKSLISSIFLDLMRISTTYNNKCM